MSAPKHDIETRVAISIAIGRYQRASDRLESASHEFTEACNGLRTHLVKPSRFICMVDFKYFLVTSDHERNFEVEELEMV